MTKYLSCLCVIISMFICVPGSQTAWADDPNQAGEATVCYPISGTTETSGDSCPSWFWVFSRDGYDGGQLTVELDGCQIVDYEHYPKPQSGGTGMIANLDPDDIFIKWDEDAGHGEGQNNDYFEFTGQYAEDPNCNYVQVTTTDSRTEWTIYRVISSGTLTKTGDCCNEHDAIHLQRNYLDFTKVDDVNDFECRSPLEEIEYTICWDNTSDYTFNNAFIIDYLPDGVDYNPLISIDPLVIDANYISEDHCYIWEIGDIAPDDVNCVTLDVTVNYKAEPGMYLHNTAELWDSNSLIARDTEDTLVCCWGDPNIIYVDITADGYDSGVSWENAYSGIDGVQKALARARNSICEGPYTIYVAQGSYSPGEDDSDSFQLPEGISVYGGFQTGGCDYEDRNPDQYQTVLTGAIDPNVQNDTVVIMSDDSELDETTLLDGFIITDGMEYGIYGYGVDFMIENCTIKNSNDFDGINAQNGNVTVSWCVIQGNNRYGVEHEGNGHAISLLNCHILNNKRNGIFTTYSTPYIKNSVVFGNGKYDSGYHGINILLPSSTATLYNNTIIGNKKAGISYFDSDPNYLQNPDYIDLQNCILWDNNDGGSQVSGLNPDDTAYYCCIQDCNDVSGRYNINDEPGFAYTTDPNNIPDPNNPYHLSWTSPCKDAGNPLFDNDDAGLYDIDAEDRISYGRIDIGADEVYSCSGNNNDDIYNALDRNADGFLNLEEFAPFAQVWLSHDPNDPAFDPNDVSYNPNLSDPNHADYISPIQKAAWDPTFNLIESGDSAYSIDLADIMDFIDNGYWLWTACWKYSQMHRFENMMIETMMMSGGGESMMMATPVMSSMSMELTAAKTTIETADTPPDYAAMPTAEIISLVTGIDAVLDEVDIMLSENSENTENLLEIKDFLNDVLSDIKTAKQ